LLPFRDTGFAPCAMRYRPFRAMRDCLPFQPQGLHPVLCDVALSGLALFVGWHTKKEHEKQILLAFGLSILVVIVFSCKPKDNLPDISLISEIMNETIKQDSLWSSIPISAQLGDYYMYIEPEKVSSDSAPPPQFANSKGEIPYEFDVLKSKLKYFLNYSTSKEDSLFVIDQISKIKNIKIDTNKIDKRFVYKDLSQAGFRDKWKDEIYVFRIPIFNTAKNMAIIEYDLFCAGCGHGQEVILKKVDLKWVVVKSILTWAN